MVDLSVVVVSYNSADLLERCLALIVDEASPQTEVFVVDNASRDGSAALVRERFPHVRLIANERNAGFGAANNAAIRSSTGRYVALVNPDCVVERGSLARLVAFLDRHPRAAVASGRLRHGDGTFQHSAFRFPSLAQVFFDFFPLHRRLAESGLNGRYPRRWDERSFPIDHPLGAFFCVRRAAIEQVGLFDEGYFMYAEEVDWCYRFKQAGWEVWHCGEAQATHLGGRSTRQRADAMFIELHKSRYRFYRTHYPVWFTHTARWLVRIGVAKLLVGEWLANARRRDGSPIHSARAQAYLEVMHL
ncbi:MAG: glycosyltransferase family 2 protein [Chloroflexi bacterium]|nr:glycosyltransferase family 2 protein [Chloroflexota bacterium]